MDLKPIQDLVLAEVEKYLEAKIVDGTLDKIMLDLKVKLEAAIPGTIDDKILEVLFPVLEPMLKEAVLALVKKI